MNNYLPVDCQQQQDYLKEAELVLPLLYHLVGETVLHLLLDKKSILLSSCIIVTVIIIMKCHNNCVREVNSACEPSGLSCQCFSLVFVVLMDHLGVFLLRPRWDASLSQLPVPINFIHLGEERHYESSSLSCKNTMSLACQSLNLDCLIHR